MNTSTSSRTVCDEAYRGFALRVVCTTRVGGPLMPTEYTVFIGANCAFDEIETLDEALTVGRTSIDQCMSR